MAKYATKAKENIFTQARYNAAKFNDRLNSREGASEELGIDRSRLARIELGSKNPFPDEVLMMSDIYNAPELKAHFCKYMCPLGKDFPEVESEDLDRISVKALSSFRKISKAKDLLLDITEDGMITEEEKGDLETITAAGIQLGMLFIDEPPFLDDDGTQAYVDSLEAIRQRYPDVKVMAITHDDAMKRRAEGLYKMSQTRCW